MNLIEIKDRYIEELEKQIDQLIQDKNNLMRRMGELERYIERLSSQVEMQRVFLESQVND